MSYFMTPNTKSSNLKIPKLAASLTLKNTQTPPVLFFILAVLIFWPLCSSTNLLFELCCLIWYIQWMNKHSVSWRGGQSCFLNGVSCYLKAIFEIMLLCCLIWNFLSLLFNTLVHSWSLTEFNCYRIIVVSILKQLQNPWGTKWRVAAQGGDFLF